MVLQNSLRIRKEAFVNTERVSIDEMIIGMSSEAKRLGFSDTFIWADFIPRLRKFAVWYDRQGLVWYDPVVTHKIVEEHKERFNKGEYSADAFSRVKTSARRLNEFYLTGTFRVYMPRRGTRYVIRSENEHLISAFIEWKKYGPNTRDDVRWVLRKYFYYLEEKGYVSLEDVPLDVVRRFITDTAEAVKPASLHNIFLYLKHFHLFLKETGIPAPDASGLFSYRVYRDKRIQDYVTDEELEKILGVIDCNTELGKRNRAIILLAATTGLRACDIIRMKLQDIDWRKGEIRLLQKKTGHMVYIPLLQEAGDAIQDYILNARPNVNCQEVFLRAFPPKVAITDPASIGSMFIAYQKKAGISRTAFDGKGFHGLRRRLAKKLLVIGTPLTTIAQILGQIDPLVVRQYLSMDVSNLKECALDFRLIPVGRGLS